MRSKFHLKKFNRTIAVLAVCVLVCLAAGVVYSQVDGGRVMLDITGGKAYVTALSPGLKDPKAVVERAFVSVSFSDPAQAHGMTAIVRKDDRDAEVKLELEGQYARGSTTQFKGMSAVGLWVVTIKGENPTGVGIYMTIDCIMAEGPAGAPPAITPPRTTPPVIGTPPVSTPPTPVKVAPPVSVPPSRPTTPPTRNPVASVPLDSINITPEVQFQALTRILIRKGLITAPELAEEIQRVAQEKR